MKRKFNLKALAFVLFLMTNTIYLATASARSNYNPNIQTEEYDKKEVIHDVSYSYDNRIHPQIRIQPKAGRTDGLLIPLDETFQIALGPNDDGFTSEINLPFTFEFYGAELTSFFINNNGNISFYGGYWTYTPTGFPVDGYPMLAPFWADVDTRPSGSGLVHYRIEPNRVTVTWDNVGYYNQKDDKLNTFQVIFTDGTDELIGIGNNVAFSYGTMEWTTGDASGGSNGFGGAPATVGINKGDGVHYALIGRFDKPGDDYDGPGGNTDGVEFLNDKVFLFNTSLSDFEEHNFGGLFVRVEETATNTNQVKYLGYEYQYKLPFLSFTLTKQSDFFSVQNGVGFIIPPSFPLLSYARNDFKNEIILYNGNFERVGYINYSFSFKYESMHSRHLVLFFHNDDAICHAPNGPPHFFPYSAESPSNPPGKTYNYYDEGDYPVSMLIPPHFPANDELPQGYRFPQSYNLSPVLFVHGLTGTFSYQFSNRVKNTATLGDQVSYWYDTERKLNAKTWPGNSRKYHAWQFYYPNEDDLTHCSMMLENAMNYLNARYTSLPVNIVAHSMGGLVTMDYLTRPGNYNNSDIGKVIMSMSPLHGSYAANRNYRTTLGWFMRLLDQDGRAPAYRDLSMGSDFIHNIHLREWPQELKDNMMTLIGLTNSSYKSPYPYNYVHKEAVNHDDGPVSVSSASLINRGVSAIGVLGNHDDGKFSKTLEDTDFLPNLIDQFLSNEEKSDFQEYCKQDPSIAFYLDVSSDNSFTGNFKYEDKADFDRNFDPHKGMITLKLPGDDSSVLYLYEYNNPDNPKYYIAPFEVFTDNYIGRLTRNFHATGTNNESTYYYTRDNYTIPTSILNQLIAYGLPVFGDATVFWGNTGFEFIEGNIPLIRLLDNNYAITIGYIDSKTMQHQYIGTEFSRFLAGFEMTPTKDIIIDDELSAYLFIDDQTESADFYLYSHLFDQEMVGYELSLLAPDGGEVGQNSENVLFYQDPYTGLNILTVSQPQPGTWTVVPVYDNSISDNIIFHTMAKLDSDIKLKSTINNHYSNTDEYITLSASIEFPDASLIDADNLSSYIKIYDNQELIETIQLNVTDLNDLSLLMTGDYAPGDLGVYKYTILVEGVYNTYNFERAFYGDFVIEDRTPKFWIPDQQMDYINNYTTILLDRHIICYECEVGEITYDVDILFSNFDEDQLLFEFFDNTKELAIMIAGDSIASNARFLVSASINNSLIVSNTFNVSYTGVSIPSDIFAYNISETSAMLIWNDGANEETWDIIYGYNGFDPNSEGIIVSHVEYKPYLISNLSHSTIYDVYVRAIIDDNPGPWSVPYSFSTVFVFTPGEDPTLEFDIDEIVFETFDFGETYTFQFTLSETGGDQPLQDIDIFASNLVDELGNVIPAANFTFTPNFIAEIPAGGSVTVDGELVTPASFDKNDIGLFEGIIIVEIALQSKNISFKLGQPVVVVVVPVSNWAILVSILLMVFSLGLYIRIKRFL